MDGSIHEWIGNNSRNPLKKLALGSRPKSSTVAQSWQTTVNYKLQYRALMVDGALVVDGALMVDIGH